MSAGTLPVVARGQLDALSHRFATLRERMALAVRVTGTGDTERACSLVFRHIFSAADSVSREDFLAASAWQPLLSGAFLDTYLAMSADLVQQGHILRNIRLPKSQRDEALHDYWNLLHAAGHLALLGTMGGEADHIQGLTARELTSRAAFSFALTSSTATKFIVQGAWAAGRLGKGMLAAYKRALGEDVTFFDWLDTVFSLVAIARRVSGLRAEIAPCARFPRGPSLRGSRATARDHERRARGGERHRRAMGGGRRLGVAARALARCREAPGRAAPGPTRDRAASPGRAARRAARELLRRPHRR